MTATLKTAVGLANASIKTFMGLAKASTKTVIGLTADAALFTDNFNRANETPIGGNWSTQDGAPPMNLTSNALVGSSASLNASFVNSVSPNNDQYAQCTMLAAAQGGPCVRMGPAPGGFDLYGFQVFGGGTQGNLYRLDNSGYTSLDLQTVTLVDGDTAKITVIGTAIKGYVNGVQVCAATDATYASGAFGMLGVGTTPSFDNFEGGNT